MKPSERDYLIDWIGNEDCVDMLQMLGSISQSVDDIYDQDKPVDAEALSLEIFSDLMSNDTFLTYNIRLMPLIRASVYGWIASNELAKSLNVRERIVAFTCRDLLAALIVECIDIFKGQAKARELSGAVWSEFTSHDDPIKWSGVA